MNFLQLLDSLVKLRGETEEGDGRCFLETMLRSLHSRFPGGWKRNSPYNSLCFLDPRNRDLYIDDEEDFESVMNVIKTDSIYNKLKRDANIEIAAILVPVDISPAPLLLTRELSCWQSELPRLLTLLKGWGRED